MVDLGFTGPSKPANDYRFVKVSDGDTPTVEMPIRMVSIDTPETSYGGNPTTAQAALERAKTRLADGTYDALPPDLRDYLISRITPDAAQRHQAAGKAAAQAHTTMVAERLTRPDGSQRKMAVLATGELIERNGRLLAYTAPWYTGTASDPLPPRDDPRRRTFNLDMIAAGWAATFVIYPSIPPAPDLNLLLAEAEAAWSQQRGAWAAFGTDLLLGYEYRACIKLGTADLVLPGTGGASDAAGARAAAPEQVIGEAFSRVCVDLRTLTEVGLYGYHRIPPAQRLWIWATDLDQARKDLPITPATG
ncbi:nuclease [Planomonospora sphaerica]|uniref:Nuclease n=1 Tax=Planomonospora sphaerica TaxID=161355 RepID=A0A161LJ07_9ACTN|nr:thermonuclease family protein [Planomonospora sphaerica]GAT68824.1 nuclease [Planomonospora sphaerica]